MKIKSLFLITASILGHSAMAEKVSEKNQAILVRALTAKANRKCAEILSNNRLANMSIDIQQYRCPMCYDVTIKGTKLGIDTPTGTLMMKLESRGVQSNFGFVENWKCSVAATSEK